MVPPEPGSGETHFMFLASNRDSLGSATTTFGGGEICASSCFSICPNDLTSSMKYN